MQSCAPLVFCRLVGAEVQKRCMKAAILDMP